MRLNHLSEISIIYNAEYITNASAVNKATKECMISKKIRTAQCVSDCRLKIDHNNVLSIHRTIVTIRHPSKRLPTASGYFYTIFA